MRENIIAPGSSQDRGCGLPSEAGGGAPASELPTVTLDPSSSAGGSDRATPIDVMMKAMTSAEPLLNLALNVAQWVPRSRVNGPGERFVLWLQGCGLACPGCWNPDTWSFAPRHLVPPATVMEWIGATPDIEGVTFSGGEPFAQAPALLPLARSIRERGLSLMIFTGHELSELRGEAHRALLGLTDIVVTGRYVESQRDLSLRWRGSRNQEVHFLTPRYAPSLLDEPAAAVEIVIESDGSVRLTGFPEDRLRSMLGS